MKRKIFVYILGLALISAISCTSKESKRESMDTRNKILQESDGTVSLILDKAARYSDEVNPSNNTADWDIVISKPGRYNVWLSSATKDTSYLNYTNSVKISFLDNHLEANPACDKVIKNSTDVHYPYYRTDSFIGSVYVSEQGEYNIQLISEKVSAEKSGSSGAESANDTKLMSVILTPMTR